MVLQGLEKQKLSMEKELEDMLKRNCSDEEMASYVDHFKELYADYGEQRRKEVRQGGWWSVMTHTRIRLSWWSSKQAAADDDTPTCLPAWLVCVIGCAAACCPPQVKFHLQQLESLLLPTQTTKMSLWTLEQGESFFKASQPPTLPTLPLLCHVACTALTEWASAVVQDTGKTSLSAILSGHLGISQVRSTTTP